MKKELKQIQKKFGTTMIYITHDQEEAFYLSDRIMVMNEGKIEQIDTPEQIFSQPRTPYIQSFVVDHLNNKLESLMRSTRRMSDGR